MKLIIPHQVRAKIDAQLTSLNIPNLNINWDSNTKQSLAAYVIYSAGLPMKAEYFSRGGTVTAEAISDILDNLGLENKPTKHEMAKSLGLHFGMLITELSTGSTITSDFWLRMAIKFESIKNQNLLQQFHSNQLGEKVSPDKEIGRSGEIFVKEYEKCRLIKNNKPELADKVEDVSKNNCGFDIYSFNINGDNRLIEVKTTGSNLDNQFFLTPNEIRASKINPDSFWLYRVYNFSSKTKEGKIKCLNGDLTSFLELSPRSFSANKKINLNWLNP
jgi:hypothetical protein